MITQSVMKLRESANTAELKGASWSRLKLSDSCQWPGRLIEIALDFGLDIDLLKRHHVCELYSAGFDKLAEEVSSPQIDEPRHEKTNILVSDLVRHKPGCTATEVG